MEIIVLILLLLGLLLGGTLFLYWGFGIRWQFLPSEGRLVFYNLIVPDEEQLVIHRLGKFRRLAGPGPVVFRWGEEPEHTIDISHRPHAVQADKLFIRGIQFHYTLDIWYRVAPEECAKNQEELAHLAHFSDRERKQMVRAQVRDALSQSIYQAEQELKKDIPYLAQLLPIVPGFPPNLTLLERTKARLEETLPEIGVQLTPGRPFIISGLALDNAIGSEFGRDRTVRLLKEQFPGMDEEMYLQAYAAIAGTTLPRSLIEIQSNGDTVVDSMIQEDGQAKPPRVRNYTNRGKKTGNVAQPQPQPTAPAEEVREGDWDVMKQLPAA